MGDAKSREWQVGIRKRRKIIIYVHLSKLGGGERERWEGGGKENYLSKMGGC